MANTIIKSEVKAINASQKEVFTFLSDFNNIKNLLPEDKISDWTSSFDECSFKIQGAATIPLVKNTVEEFSRINIVSGPKAPFPFTLVAYINELDGGEGCESYLIFDGEINAFLKMMVAKPLTNLFDYMSRRLAKQF